MRRWAAGRSLAPLLLIAFATWLGIPGAALFVKLANATGGRGLAAPLSALLPLVIAIALAGGLARRDATRGAPVRRRVLLLDVAAVLLSLALLGAVAAWVGEPMLWESFRNAVGYCGLTLLSAALLPLRGAALPAIGWAIGAAMGLLPPGNDLLAWPMAPALAPLSWAVPLALILIGPVAYLTRTPRL